MRYDAKVTFLRMRPRLACRPLGAYERLCVQDAILVGGFVNIRRK